MNKIKFCSLLIILVCLTLLCGCFSDTGSIYDEISTGKNSVDNIYEQSFAIEDSDTLTDELINTLVDFLQDLYVQYDLVASTLSDRIDKIKNGQQPMLVDFDPTNFYYVCGYYDGITENGPLKYRNSEEYTWVRFESTNEIKDTYEGKKFIVAFQINKALLVRDIVSPQTILPRVEHFQMYEPIFENGVNTNTHVVFEEEFIYSNKSSAERIYHSTSLYYHQLVTINCINYDNEYYILQYVHSIHINGEKDERNLKGEFSNYYDTLISIMDTSKCSVTRENGRVDCYGLIDIDDFVNRVINLK